MERLFFDNGRGVRLCGVLEMPAPDAPIVILSHGFASSKDSGTYTTIAPALATAGIGSFRFDFYGHGESGGEFSKITLTEGVEDVKAAYAYLKTRFPSSPLGLLGSSFGGACSFYAAASLDVKGCVLLCPAILYKERYLKKTSASGLAEWKRKGSIPYKTYDGRALALDYSFYESLLGFDGVTTAPELKMPFLILHGDRDQVVDHADSEKIVKLLPHGELITIKGADHDLHGPGERERIVAETVKFFQDL